MLADIRFIRQPGGREILKKTTKTINAAAAVALACLLAAGCAPAGPCPVRSWVPVGSAGFTPQGAYFLSLAVDGNVPWIAFKDGANGGRATVMRWNGTAWKTAGAAGFSSGAANFISLVVHDGVPYVAYQDGANGNRATVMRLQ